ncbi:hypothetical protein niasHS_008105 [Heterodera schachtii]|uniref:Uncharacterized protein n=1 Tax=Heterodera schachtii TaxID=97005 RepID=A0ABD2JA32_HETSC
MFYPFRSFYDYSVCGGAKCEDDVAICFGYADAKYGDAAGDFACGGAKCADKVASGCGCAYAKCSDAASGAGVQTQNVLMLRVIVRVAVPNVLVLRVIVRVQMPNVLMLRVVVSELQSCYSHKDCSWLKPEMMDCQELMNDFTIDCIIPWVFGALKGQELPEEIGAKLRRNKDYIEYNHARAPTGHVHTYDPYRLRQGIDGG